MLSEEFWCKFWWSPIPSPTCGACTPNHELPWLWSILFLWADFEHPLPFAHQSEDLVFCLSFWVWTKRPSCFTLEIKISLTCTSDGHGCPASPINTHSPPTVPALPGFWAGSSSLQCWGLHNDAEWEWQGGSTELQMAHSSPQGSVRSETLPWGACRESREPYLWHFHGISALCDHWDLKLDKQFKSLPHNTWGWVGKAGINGSHVLYRQAFIL